MRRRRAPSWALGGLAAAQHEHARGQPGAVEEVRRQTDHRLDEILLEQEASDVALDAATEQRALGQHDRHATGPVGHGLDHVLYPGEVAARIRGQAREGAPPGIALPDLAPPLLERERRIGDDHVERGEPTRAGVTEHRHAKRVAALDDEVLDAVEKQVHPRDRRGGEVLLLA